MKPYTFQVLFFDQFISENNPINVRGFNKKEAKILAQAQRIRAGLNYKVKSITQLEEQKP